MFSSPKLHFDDQDSSPRISADISIQVGLRMIEVPVEAVLINTHLPASRLGWLDWRRAARACGIDPQSLTPSRRIPAKVVLRCPENCTEALPIEHMWVASDEFHRTEIGLDVLEQVSLIYKGARDEVSRIARGAPWGLVGRGAIEDMGPHFRSTSY